MPKEMEYHKKIKRSFFVTYFRKIEIYSIKSERFPAFISSNFEDYGLQMMKPKIPVSEIFYIVWKCRFESCQNANH